MLHAMTFILSDKEEVFCFANQLKRMLKNTCSETLAPMGISDDIEVVVILEINQKTIDHNAFRSSLTEFVVPKSMLHVQCFALLLFVIFSFIQLANNVTSHNNS